VPGSALVRSWRVLIQTAVPNLYTLDLNPVLSGDFTHNSLLFPEIGSMLGK
jgi:hypothetical protein